MYVSRNNRSVCFRYCTLQQNEEIEVGSKHYILHVYFIHSKETTTPKGKSYNTIFNNIDKLLHVWLTRYYCDFLFPVCDSVASMNKFMGVTF